LFSNFNRCITRGMCLIVSVLSVQFFVGSAWGAALNPVCQENYAPEVTRLAGNVVVEITVDTACVTNNRYRFYDAVNASVNVIEACDTSYVSTDPNFNIVPDGMIVVGKDANTSCSALPATTRPTLLLSKIRTSDTRLTVCAGSSISQGWIIVERIPEDLNCGSGTSTGVSYVIVKATASSYPVVCDSTEFAIPEGYVITSRYDHADCAYGPGINTGPTKSIQLPSLDSLWVCEGSKPSADYVYTNYEPSYANCDYRPAWLLSKLQGTGPLIACNFHSVGLPPNWIITELKFYPQCNGSLGATVKLGQNNDFACEYSLLPDGAVITEKTTLSACAAGPSYSQNAYKIYFPDESTYNSPIFICLGPDIPIGWAFSQTGTSSLCNYSSGTGASGSIQPLSTLTQGSWVCVGSGFVVPTGWIITVVDNTYQCNTASTVSYFIEPARNGHACSPSMVPEGYVITQWPDPNLGVCEQNASFYIYELTGEDIVTACVGSPIPEGYGFTNVRTVSGCNGPAAGMGFDVHVLNPAGDTVCSGSPIPPEYVVTSAFHSSACDTLDGVAYNIEIPSKDGQTLACITLSPVPADMVIVSQTQSSTCSANGTLVNAAMIAYPADQLYICSGTNIPFGFIAEGPQVPNSNCAAGYAILLIEIPFAKDPVEFINEENDVVPGAVPGVNYDCTNAVPFAGILNGASKNQASCP